MDNTNTNPRPTSQVVTFRMSADAFADYKARCARENRTMSEAARQGVADYMATPAAKRRRKRKADTPTDPATDTWTLPDFGKWQVPDFDKWETPKW
jgi:hypothetical protein